MTLVFDSKVFEELLPVSVSGCQVSKNHFRFFQEASLGNSILELLVSYNQLTA